jgi:hypothetical protein
MHQSYIGTTTDVDGIIRSQPSFGFFKISFDYVGYANQKKPLP